MAPSQDTIFGVGWWWGGGGVVGWWWGGGRHGRFLKVLKGGFFWKVFFPPFLKGGFFFKVFIPPFLKGGFFKGFYPNSPRHSGFP